MKQVRLGVFETNSSSVHSMCICSPDEYAAFQNGELHYDRWNDVLVGQAAFDGASEDERKDRYWTYDTFGESWYGYYDTFGEDITSPSGDKMVAFGYFGRDG